MWNYSVISLCILISVPNEICAPRKWKPRVNMISYVRQKQAEYENSHRNMFATEAEYKSWPELTIEVEIVLCKKYTDKLFKRKTKSVVATRSTSVWLNYPETQNKSDQLWEKILVAALKCEILPPAQGCKYMFFIRSPKNACLYFISHRIASSCEFFIAEEICEYGRYNYWDIFQSKKYESNHKHTYVQKRISDNADKLKEYETNHLKDYLFHKDEYVKWTDYREKNAKRFCATLLIKLLSKRSFSQLDVKAEKIELHYAKIVQAGDIVPDVTVSVLKCQMPKKCYQFIKAPIHKCVYLIKRRNSRYTTFIITKLLCEEDNVNQSVNQIGLEYSEKQDKIKREFGEIKEPQSEDESRVEYNEYKRKDPSITNK